MIYPESAKNVFFLISNVNLIVNLLQFNCIFSYSCEHRVHSKVYRAWAMKLKCFLKSTATKTPTQKSVKFAINT